MLRYLRLFELGCELDDSIEELLVFAIERRFLRLAGHIEHTKYDDKKNCDGSQDSYRHVPPGRPRTSFGTNHQTPTD